MLNKSKISWLELVLACIPENASPTSWQTWHAAFRRTASQRDVVKNKNQASEFENGNKHDEEGEEPY